MAENYDAELQNLKERINAIHAYLHIEDKRDQIEILEEEAAAPDFWNNQSKAQSVMSKVSSLRDQVTKYEYVAIMFDDAKVAKELMSEDESMASELEDTIAQLNEKADDLEIASWFDGEFDDGDCVISINPGAGGLEAQDWTEMLFRMITKYCESKDWKVTVNDAPTADVIGLDHATFTVSGHNAYGMLRSEDGVHRLVRISPTDEKKRRHTTFAAVQVLPLLPDEIEVDIDQNDLRIDVYRSSGPGGQCVNTTDSAVRITHIPTGIVVTCQNEKSQIQNRETAMRILKARLYELEKQKRQEELDELRGDKKHIEFGSQIRNYVLYPYQLVKDVRSGVESGNVEAVLDGDLDKFVIGYHRWRVNNK